MGTKTVKRDILRGALALLLCSIFIVSSYGSTYAATAAPKAPAQSVNNNTNTLKLSPLRTDITINPGETGTVKTYLTNVTGTAIAIKPIENDFVAGDESGTPSIILDENSYAPTHSLKRFMIPLQNFTVAPGETKEVDVKIVVPKTAQAGGYYGAIRFAPASPDGNQQVNLGASVASLILMTVPGDVVEKLAITNFDIQQNGGTATNFRDSKNMQLLLRFQNKGNVQESPFGQVFVKKGDKVLYTYNFNQTDPKATVLPDSARRWEIPLKGFGKFGKYTVAATFTYGSKNQSMEMSKTIWIVPTTYIFAGIGALILLILLIVGIVFGLRGYKRRILRGSSRGYNNRRRY